jgi:ArsR family transcriptional regulator
MAKALSAALNRIDLMFRAFSDHTRLRILRLLQRGECCVGDLVAILWIEQPSASRHLAYLRKAGLVVVRRSKQWSYYSLAPSKGGFHAKLLECLACCFAEVPELRADEARARKLKASGGCCPETDKPTEESPKPRGCCSEG